MPTTKELINAMAHAMAIQEGFYDKPGKFGDPIPRKMHNPGDLRTWLDAAGKPYPEVNGYVDFPACQIVGCKHPDHPAQVGWHALRVQVWNCVVKRGLTFLEFFAGKPGIYAGFAPEKDKNDPLGYATKVLERMRVALTLDPAITIYTKVLSLASDGTLPALASKPVLGVD